MKTPLSRTCARYLELKAEIDVAIAGILSRGWYILGNEVAAFEEEFAQYLGANTASVLPAAWMLWFYP